MIKCKICKRDMASEDNYGGDCIYCMALIGQDPDAIAELISRLTDTSAIEEGIIQGDGGLYDLGWYLSWNVGEETAILDGPFTADELIAIGNHMKQNRND